MSGSGSRIGGTAVITVAALASFIATTVSCISLWTHLKQYRKPLMQRYVVRIMVMVPLYAIASWISLLSFKAASFIGPVRDVYEAFVIYCFFNLLINYLGGERAIIIMTHGRQPKYHLWPMRYFCERVDISDPYTFLTLKRGILQYAWLKPVLALATTIMKATDSFQEGYIGLSSGYFWSGLLYNLSISVSLYSLAMFWVCLHEDLIPFRPVPKFLVIKLIIFASYWQGFLLSIMVFLGIIKDSPGYSSDNISLAIQDALTCFEMPFFAVAHWYAFSVTDYIDPSISCARMPIMYAVRDSFGLGDLIIDTKDTLFGKRYGYQLFDPGENVMAHADGSGRMSRIKEGLRYERGGKGKYWVPKPQSIGAKTSLLDGLTNTNSSYTQPVRDFETRYRHFNESRKWNAEEPIELKLEASDEDLFKKARTMEFGDYNFPVIEMRNKRGMRPGTISTATHQALLKQPPAERDIVKGKKREPLQSHPSRDDVRDVIVEDENWEEQERIRKRREGNAITDHDDQLRRFVHLDATSYQEAEASGHQYTRVASESEAILDQSEAVGAASASGSYSADDVSSPNPWR